MERSLTQQDGRLRLALPVARYGSASTRAPHRPQTTAILSPSATPAPAESWDPGPGRGRIRRC